MTQVPVTADTRPKRWRRSVEVGVDIVLTIVVVAVGVRYFSTSRAEALAPSAAPPSRVADSLWARAEAGHLVFGAPTAPIAVVEFVDVQCPFCATAARMLDSLVDRYPEKVRVVVKHFPLGFHRSARVGAAALECARPYGSARRLSRRLYDRQKTLDNMSSAEYVRPAEATDSAQFVACMNSDSVRGVIDADISLGAAMGVAGTPTLFVGGVRLPAVSIDSLRKLIVAHVDGAR
jgi:protein-disulfide isomerase